jgi:hypothetical protein
VPIDSVPKPRTSRSCTRNFTASTSGPGVCWPVSSKFWYSTGSLRLDQSVRISTQAFPGMRPCRFSHRFMNSSVKRKSGSAAASLEQSTTQAGPMKRSGGMLSVALCGRSLPETQWIGASKWVPVCSPQEKLFQYQAGPRSS